MAIEIDFGRELGRLAFPDDVTDEQAQSYVRENYQAIRQGLLTQRQEQLAAETQAEEAAKLRAGDIGTLETVGGQLYEAPRAAGRMLGQAAKGFARVFEAGAPDIEVTPEEQATILARSPITQAGEKLVTAAEELPVIPGVEKTIPGQVMGGVGSVAGLLPATLVGGPIAGGAVYGFSAGEEAAEDARRTINRRIAERLAIGDVAGADDLRAQLPQLEAAAFGITAPIGAVTEGALGLAGKIGRVGPGRPTIGGVGSKLAEAMIPKAASIRTQNMIRGGIEGAVTEGLQESLEQTLGNMAAKVTYDPERGVMDGVAQAGFIGAASGGFVGGIVGSRKNLAAANAVAEATGADPGNPLPRSTATVAGIQDGPQPTGPIEIEPEVTPEEVLRMSQELGIPVPPEMVTPATAAQTPASAPTPTSVTPVPAPEPATAAIAPTQAAAVAQPTVGVRKISEFGADNENREYQIDAGGQRAGQANLARNEDGTWKVEMVVVDTPGMGIGPMAYEQIHSQLEAEGSGLTSGSTGSLSKSAIRMWEKLVSTGKAEKTGQTYRMKPTSRTAVVTPTAAPVDTETGLTTDEQAELDTLIEKEDAGTLTEDDSITLAFYRSRLGFPAQPTTPTPSAVQEQGADEGVLRREEPQPPVQVELREVDQGGRPAEVRGAEAEVTPEEVQQVKAEVVPETPVPAPTPAPAPEYTPARINKLFQTLKARATAVGKGLYEIKKLAPGQRAVLRTRFGGLQETDQFLLREKSQVTGNPSDEGYILRDKQEATAGEAPRPAPAPAPAEPTLQYTDEDFAAAPSREAAGNMAVTQVRTNPSLPPRPPQIFYTLEAVANRAAKRPYDPKNLTAELIKQAQDSGLLTAAKNPKLTADGQRSLADGQRQSQERKAAQANLSDALRERAVLAWDAANDPQSAAYRERIAAKPAPAPAVKPTPTPAPTPQADPNEKLATFIEDVDGAITNLESPAKLRAMVKKAVNAGYITAKDAAEIASVQRSMGSAEDTTDAFGEFAGLLNMELEKRRKAPVAAPAAPAATKPISTAPATEPAPAQVQEVKMPPAEKQGTEPLAPKAQKQFLLAQIDEAIAAAPEEATSEKIVISVPGDGEFTLLNYKAALTRFKDLAKKFPVGPLARESKPRTEAKQALKLGALNTKNAVKAASEAVADPTYRPGSPLTAVFSDGKRVVGSNGKILLEVEANGGGTVAKPITVDESGKPVQFEASYPNVDQVIPKTTTVVSRKINTERLFSVLTQAYQAAYDSASKDPDREANAVIVQNRDGSIGLFSEVPGKTSYSHNVRKGAKVLTSYNIRLLTDLIQAMRRVGVSEFDLSVADEKDRSLRTDAGVLTAPGVKGLIMPIRMETYEVPTWAAEPDTGRPDSVEALLQKVIAATDPKGKAFEAITALSSVVIYQATKIALRIYQATKSWVAARNAGMDYIKSHVQLQNEPETAANFEEFLKAVPNQEIPAGTPELPQPPSPAERVESRGLFVGDIERDTDENWASEAKKWVDFFKGNLERAFQVVLTADIDNAFKEYILGEIIQRNQLDIARAKGVEVLRALNLEKRLAESAKSLGAITAKAMAARKLAQERFWWAQPAMILRNLIRKRQDELIPFSKIESEQVRKWLTESGREAVNQIREAMKKADNVFAREFRKIKQVPGEPDGPPIEIKWQDILTQALDTQGSVRQKMLQVILADPRLRNLSPAGIAEITNLLTKAWEAKRNQIFRAEFRKKVPLPNVKPDIREKLLRSIPRILKYANIARATPGSFSIQDGPDTFLLWEQAFRDAVAPEFGVAELNGATARKITDLAQKAQAQSGVNRNEIIQQMFRLMAREGGVRFSDVLRDYWYAAVLSGIRTQVDNAMNVFNGFLNTAMFATMAKKDAGFIAYSALKGLDEGIRDFWPMLWRGELYRSVNFNPDQPGSALEGLGQSRNLFAKGISQFKYVSRLINALDHMTALMSDATAKAYALRKLYPEGVARQYLTPSPEVVAAARARAIAEGTRPELVNKRTREILQEKLPVDVLMTAKEIREMTTFTETPQGLLGSLYRGLDQAAQGKTLYKVLSGTNFLRFAANSANEILNFALPVALYRYYQSAPGRSEGEYGLKFSESRRDLILAKAAFGTALGIFAGALFLGDDDKEEDRNIDITGSFKSLDPNKRKQLLAEGRQPYSIRFGNTYVSYRQLGFGGVLATIGELRDRQLFSPDKWSQENIVEKVLDGAAAGMFIVKDSTAISGLTELLGFANAYKYDTDEFIEKSFPRYVSRLAGSLVPNILKEVDAWSDPSIFKTEAGNLGYEYFLQQVPFGRREIGPGPILNVLGEPVKVERYPWSRWAKEREDDLAWGTLGKLASRGVFMPTPAITVKVNENGTRRELTREEKYQYQQAVGQGYRKFIEQNSKRLLALPPAEAADFIDKNADRIRRNARTNLKNSF